MSDVEQIIAAELERLGCDCASHTDAAHEGEKRAWTVSGPHRDDCPAVLWYSKPENQP